jgi:glycosyltransferase involved in cell wall biosynthesis
VLLLADQSLQKNLDAYFSAVAAARGKGAQLAYLVHDLQPLLDKTAFGPRLSMHFLVWWSQVLRFADRIITVSRKVAGDIACYVSVTSMVGLTPTRKLPVSHFRLGSNALVEQGKGKKNPDLPGGSKAFYVVGNLFGYKGVLTVLKAMELLWAEGSKAVLVVVGKDLSNMVARAELQAHPEFGKKFIMPGFVPDAELAHALQNCGALIVASRMEGFGLPLVEAAALGCPVIARDIEIFRETSGGRAFFFPDGGAEEIAAALRKWLKLSRKQQLQYVPGQSLITWRQSAEMLQSILISDESHFALDVGLTATLNLVTPKKGAEA